MTKPVKPEGWVDKKLCNLPTLTIAQEQVYVDHLNAMEEYMRGIAEDVLAFLSNTDLSTSEALWTLERTKKLVKSKRNNTPLSAVMKEETA